MDEKDLQKSLMEALSWSGVKEIPPIDDKKNVWIYALALVCKRDGSRNYAILMKGDTEDNDRIIKDFGAVSQIVSIEEVRPYVYLDSSYVPDFKSSKNKKEDKIAWLKLMHPDGKFDEMDAKQLNRAIINTAIRNQLRDNTYNL